MRILWLVLIVTTLFFFPTKVKAKGEVLGIHVLSTNEVKTAAKLFEKEMPSSHYITIPFTLEELNHKQKWQDFLNQCSDLKLVPIIRLATRFESGSWQIPTRKDIMSFSAFFADLDWKREELILVLFNEPNHKAEWGGKIDPIGFADITKFALDWFHTDSKKYVILPAGLDLAAPNGKTTMEAFDFWRQAVLRDPGIFDKLDGWTSHSYPNPGFAGSPYRTDKLSLRGFVHELNFIRRYTVKSLPVYITETGWDSFAIKSKNLNNYYRTAYRSVWNDERIRAVTPFLLQGSPGMFSAFSFLDALGRPTQAYVAYRNLLNL